ncbi:hypothetical protein [Paraburkholderia sediminicola]|uniref:hypothetical protein n=1 Tax=Paraburkholderia sediminicola TaxID=458836 RepID=UPI0038BD959D
MTKRYQETAASLAKRSVDEAAPARVPGDLIIEMSPKFGSCSYYGSRALLEAEGVIPSGTEWPIGFTSVKWDAGQFHFRLMRTRPDGAKGHRKIFAECDWWQLWWHKINDISWEDRAIARKTKELKDILYRHSERGKKEWSARYQLFYAAGKDQRFQAFKTLIPGLVRPKRGRKAASQGDSNVQ